MKAKHRARVKQDRTDFRNILFRTDSRRNFKAQAEMVALQNIHAKRKTYRINIFKVTGKPVPVPGTYWVYDTEIAGYFRINNWLLRHGLPGKR